MDLALTRADCVERTTSAQDTHTRMCTSTQTRAGTQTHRHTHTHVRARMHAYRRIRVRVGNSAPLRRRVARADRRHGEVVRHDVPRRVEQHEVAAYIYIYVYTCVYIYVYTCIYMHMYMYMYL